MWSNFRAEPEHTSRAAKMAPETSPGLDKGMGNRQSSVAKSHDGVGAGVSLPRRNEFSF